MRIALVVSVMLAFAPASAKGEDGSDLQYYEAVLCPADKDQATLRRDSVGVGLAEIMLGMAAHYAARVCTALSCVFIPNLE